MCVMYSIFDNKADLACFDAHGNDSLIYVKIRFNLNFTIIIYYIVIYYCNIIYYYIIVYYNHFSECLITS